MQLFLSLRPFTEKLKQYCLHGLIVVNRLLLCRLPEVGRNVFEYVVHFIFPFIKLYKMDYIHFVSSGFSNIENDSSYQFLTKSKYGKIRGL